MSDKPKEIIDPIDTDFDEVARSVLSPRASRRPALDKSDALPLPFSEYAGELQLGDSTIECYVLDTGRCVLGLCATIKAIARMDDTCNMDGTCDLGDYIGIQALKPFVDSDWILGEIKEFHVPGTQIKRRGIPVGIFLNICQAYVSALSEDRLKTDGQREIAVHCSVLLESCAKAGLVALIKEASGYRHASATDTPRMESESEAEPDWGFKSGL